MQSSLKTKVYTQQLILLEDELREKNSEYESLRNQLRDVEGQATRSKQLAIELRDLAIIAGQPDAETMEKFEAVWTLGIIHRYSWFDWNIVP